MNKIHHIGISIKLENRAKYLHVFRKYGGKLVGIGVCEKFKTKCTFIDLGNVLIELIYDINGGELVSNYLKTHKEGSIHHLAFRSKFKGGVKGALKGMRIKFNPLEENGNILIEEVDFDEL